MRNITSKDCVLAAAGIVISLVPSSLIFVLFQEQVMKGILGGAVKG